MSKEKKGRRPGRRKAREIVLQAQYWSESAGEAPEETCAWLIHQDGLDEGLRDFALDLSRKAAENRGRFDLLISQVSENWALERIARVDRIILHMALSELLLMKDIPVKVALDEALELAKKFGAEKSAAFVNGILDAIVRREGLLEPSSQNSPENGRASAQD